MKSTYTGASNPPAASPPSAANAWALVQLPGSRPLRDRAGSAQSSGSATEEPRVSSPSQHAGFRGPPQKRYLDALRRGGEIDDSQPASASPPPSSFPAFPSSPGYYGQGTGQGGGYGGGGGYGQGYYGARTPSGSAMDRRMRTDSGVDMLFASPPPAYGGRGGSTGAGAGAGVGGGGIGGGGGRDRANTGGSQLGGMPGSPFPEPASMQDIQRLIGSPTSPPVGLNSSTTSTYTGGGPGPGPGPASGQGGGFSGVDSQG